MKLFLSFSFLLISIFVNAQPDSIDKFLEKQIKEQSIVGLSIIPLAQGVADILFRK